MPHFGFGDKKNQRRPKKNRRFASAYRPRSGDFFWFSRLSNFENLKIFNFSFLHIRFLKKSDESRQQTPRRPLQNDEIALNGLRNMPWVSVLFRSPLCNKKARAIARAFRCCVCLLTLVRGSTLSDFGRASRGYFSKV